MKRWEKILKKHPEVKGFQRPYPSCDFTVFIIGDSKDYQMATIMDQAPMKIASKLIRLAIRNWEDRQ